MDNQNKKQGTYCTATTRLGQPCRAWAVLGTDPPRCAPHGGTGAKPGAPEGNRNAVTHGFYANQLGSGQTADEPMLAPQPGQDRVTSPETGIANAGEYVSAATSAVAEASTLSEIIAYITQDLFNKYLALSNYIDRHLEELPLPEMAHLFALHAQTATRLGRLLRDQHIINADSPSSLDNAMDIAFDQLSEIFGVQL